MEQKRAVFYFEKNKNDMSEKEFFGYKKNEGQGNPEDVDWWTGLEGRNWKYTKDIVEREGGNVGHQKEHASTKLNLRPWKFMRIQSFIAFELRVGI